MTELNESYSRVQDWCKDIKVPKETVRGKAAKQRAEKKALKERALQMKDSGMTPAQIAQKLESVDPRTIYRWLRKN